jgi:hypothetical protein
MPETETVERAERDKRDGKSPSTQAGEFVRKEIHHIREGKHGARSTKQAIAIGLSKARRAGVKLQAPKGKTSAKTRRRAELALKHAWSRRKPSATRSRAIYAGGASRGPFGGFEIVFGAAGAFRRPQTWGSGSVGCRREGRPHQGTEDSGNWSAQSGKYPSSPKKLISSNGGSASG